MDFTGYRSDALGAAVELVNAVTAAPTGDQPAADALRTIIVRHGYLAGRAPASAEQALAQWAGRLRTVFDAAADDDAAYDDTAYDGTAYDDTAAAAAAVNALLAEVVIAPHLSGHDGQRWHLHYSPPTADVIDRVRSTTAFALAMLVSEYGIERHGCCAAAGCRRVFADTSRNAARRYCSQACANRSAVAAHRARARAGQTSER